MSTRATTLLRHALLLVALAPACTSDRDDDDGHLAEQLIACDLITSGELPSAITASDPFQACIYECIAAGTCAELETYVCNGGVNMMSDTCSTQCLETHGHTCDDGEVLPPDQVCDGFMKCSDGSDELGCPPPFTCGDGTEIAPTWACDGRPDCADESDEVDCPPGTTFSCTNGKQIPAIEHCNFEDDCGDSSDEEDCAMIVCPN